MFTLHNSLQLCVRSVSLSLPFFLVCYGPVCACSRKKKKFYSLTGRRCTSGGGAREQRTRRKGEGGKGGTTGTSGRGIRENVHAQKRETARAQSGQKGANNRYTRTHSTHSHTHDHRGAAAGSSIDPARGLKHPISFAGNARPKGAPIWPRPWPCRWRAPARGRSC